MKITNDFLYKSSLLASIAHAIMTNVYPEFSYEQSWDGKNYSIQNSQGVRGTITFEDGYCVCAIRNDLSSLCNDANLCEKLTDTFPSFVKKTVQDETFQYLLVEDSGMVFPLVTSVFWADNNGIYYNEDNFQNLDDDLMLLKTIFLPNEDAIAEWRDYYNMDDDAIKLLRFLLSQKESDFFRRVVLDTDKISLIPGDGILDECFESFKELNIVIQR